MTPKERIQIRDFLNRFSDRWPEEYNEIYHQFSDYGLFQVCLLWHLIQIDDTLDDNDIRLIQELIAVIEKETYPSRKQPETRTTVSIEDISDGKL